MLCNLMKCSKQFCCVKECHGFLRLYVVIHNLAQLVGLRLPVPVAEVLLAAEELVTWLELVEVGFTELLLDVLWLEMLEEELVGLPLLELDTLLDVGLTELDEVGLTELEDVGLTELDEVEVHLPVVLLLGLPVPDGWWVQALVVLVTMVVEPGLPVLLLVGLGGLGMAIVTT